MGYDIFLSGDGGVLGKVDAELSSSAFLREDFDFGMSIGVGVDGAAEGGGGFLVAVAAFGGMIGGGGVTTIFAFWPEKICFHFLAGRVAGFNVTGTVMAVTRAVCEGVFELQIWSRIWLIFVGSVCKRALSLSEITPVTSAHSKFKRSSLEIKGMSDLEFRMVVRLV